MLFNLLQQLFKMLARRILMQDEGMRGDGRRQRAARWRRGGTLLRQWGGGNRTEKVLHRIRWDLCYGFLVISTGAHAVWHSVAQFLGCFFFVDMVTCQKKGCRTAAVYGATLSCTVLQTFCVEPSIGSCFMARVVQCCRAVIVTTVTAQPWSRMSAAQQQSGVQAVR
jgi:hypothetical protein